MKKLFLLVVLVVFLTPIVVNAKNFLKPINLKKDSSMCIDTVDKFGIDCSAYIIKSDIACHAKPNKSKKCYIDTFEKKGSGSPSIIGNTHYGIILGVHTLYKIIEVKNINNQDWIKLCPYTSYDGIALKSRNGDPYEECGWTNQTNKFELASTVLLDFHKKTREEYAKELTITINPDSCSMNLNKGVINKDCIGQKSPEFDSLALSLGCAPKRKDVEDCVKRYLPSVIGSGPINSEEFDIFTKSSGLMKEVRIAIEELNRQQNQSQNREPTEEEKQQALAQQNATGQATWKYTSTGIGYFDYGNGFGWAPPNPKRDKIIQGLLVSQSTKNKLMIGSKGRTIFVPR